MTISDLNYYPLPAPVKPSTPLKLSGQVIYLKDCRLARRIRAVRLAAGGKGK
jgi:hypothetical protein